MTSTLDQIGEALHDCQQRLSRAIFGLAESPILSIRSESSGACWVGQTVGHAVQ